MRTFIVSDLHGNGQMYSQIISYLENINKDDEVVLYINGDLIDRGTSSASMLIDVIDRIKNNKGFQIKYLAGNHELMMYQTSLRKNVDKWPKISNWYIGNGGLITLESLKKLVNEQEENEILEFISNLDIYHKFDTKIIDKNIVLVHAKCPKNVKNTCDLKLKDNNLKVYNALWPRKEGFAFLSQNLGNKKYFTIIGHTPVFNEKGYRYNEKFNYMNIDGGCARYVQGDFDYNHTPLVEIDEKNERLIILTFNNQNEIILGHYFIGNLSIRMDENMLNKHRKYVEKNANKKVLKLEP